MPLGGVQNDVITSQKSWKVLQQVTGSAICGTSDEGMLLGTEQKGTIKPGRDTEETCTHTAERKMLISRVYILHDSSRGHSGKDRTMP